MPDFQSILSAARDLPAEDRIRLIDALWETVSASDESFSREWVEEIERRVAELEQGTAEIIPWSTIRDEALARIGHGRPS
jgi:putative addiction module component (TIGR02574 family)